MLSNSAEWERRKGGGGGAEGRVARENVVKLHGSGKEKGGGGVGPKSGEKKKLFKSKLN